MDFSYFEGKTALEIFRTLAPEFAAVPDEQVSAAIGFAAVFLCEESYGSGYQIALALMAAHIMAQPGGANGGYSSSTQKVTAKKEGDLSLNFGSVSDSDTSWLGGSTYGQMLLLLQKRLGMHLVFMTRGAILPCEPMDWKFQ